MGRNYIFQVEIWRKLATKINTGPAQTPGPPPLGPPPPPPARQSSRLESSLFSLSFFWSVFHVLCRYRGGRSLSFSLLRGLISLSPLQSLGV